MPRLDFESLPSICIDRKITCDPDIPPESFWLSKDAEFEWFDRNAFLDRNESIKGNSNSMNLNPNVKTVQFLKPKGNIISLPNAQKTRKNCRLANILLFPKRLDSISRETTKVSMTEPMSPKVSCLGRVRSKGCSRGKTDTPQKEREKPITPKTGFIRKTGFVCCVKSLFGSICYKARKSKKLPLEINEASEYSAPRKPAVDSP